MAYELIYTSVPRGLKPGSRGFATVAFTEGMPANYVQTCEGISGYTHAFPPQDPNYARNPVAFSHHLFRLGGQLFSVLSRVAAYGTDYSERSNKLAHHVMASEAERVSAGPAWAMTAPNFFVTEWKQEPHLIKAARQVRDMPVAGCRAEQWQRRAGDAGWAGAMAQRFLATPDKPVFLIFQPGQDLLPLVAEVTSLLPPDKRWAFTFSTYFTALPQGTDCFLRCCLPTGEGLKMSRRSPDALILDLTGPKQPLTETGPLVEAARTGVMPAVERIARPAYVPRPVEEEAKSELRKVTQSKVRVSYDSNKPTAPTTKHRRSDKRWLIPVTVAAALCILAGSTIWVLPHARTMFKRTKTAISQQPQSNSSTNIISNTTASAQTPPINLPPLPRGTNAIPTNSLPSIKAVKLAEPLLPKKLDMLSDKMPGSIEQLILKPRIEFLSVASLSKSSFSTNFCSSKTRCSLYNTLGGTEELAPPIKIALKSAYSFKAVGGQWIMEAWNSGLLPPETPGTNVAIARFNNDNRYILFLVFRPITLVRLSDTEYRYPKDSNSRHELSNVITNARITVAMLSHPAITGTWDVPVTGTENGVKITYGTSGAYETFIEKDPERMFKANIKGFLNALDSCGGDIFKTLATGSSCSNLVWKEVGKALKDGKTGLDINKLGHLKEIDDVLNGKHSDFTRKYIYVPMDAFKSRYNDVVSKLEDKLQQNNAADVSQNYAAIEGILNSSTSVLSGLDLKDHKNKKIHGYFDDDIGKLKKNLVEWKNAISQNVSKVLRDRLLAAEKKPEVRVVNLVCSISDIPILNWSEKKP